MNKITITINANSDTITINNVIELPCKNPTNIRHILDELLNSMRHSLDQSISLQYIDEDKREVVGEW